MFRSHLAFILLVVSIPVLGPAVGEVNDEDELDKDEEETSHQPEVHPHLGEGGVAGDPEGADHPTDNYEILDPPAAVLEEHIEVID